MTGTALAVNLFVRLSESAESAEGGHSVNPYLAGGITLAILLAALMAVLAIGGGRDHS